MPPSPETTGDAELDRDTSQAIFARTGLVSRIDVGVPVESLRVSGSDGRG